MFGISNSISPRAIVVCAAIFLFAGCAVGPDFKRPQPTTMPAEWLPLPPLSIPTTSPTTVPATQASITTDEQAGVARWWRVFDDPMLESLIDRAVESNLDLKQATSRVRQARASRGVAGA